MQNRRSGCGGRGTGRIRRVCAARVAAHLFVAWIGLSVAGVVHAQPVEQWMKYPSPEAAGFDSGSLAEARVFFGGIGGAAGLLVVDGVIVANWGDTNRRFFDASIRKSYLHALIGIAVAEGAIGLEQSLADLQIDDRLGLSAAERRATVRDLLGARSGVYHPGAFEADAWKSRRPARGAYAPGEHWFYNNWDFNVLGHIYERAAGESIGRSFSHRIAEPLGFQDFRPIDFTYFDEPDVSDYPAYLFRTTARDMARFGLLYLNSGKWGERQIIPKQWITASLGPRSQAFSDGTGYGYLWWYYEIDGKAVHYAHGAPGQGIYLVPELDLVFVFRPNTYGPVSVSDRQTRELLRLIFAARSASTREASADMEARQLRHARWPERLPGARPVSPDEIRPYSGTYPSRAVGPITLHEETETAYFSVNRGTFRVMIRGRELLVEDIEVPLRFPADEQRAGTAEFVRGPGGATFEIYVRSDR